MIFKVIAALYVFNRKQPLPKMKQQPHTLLFMPVYSEDEATLRKTIDSLSESEYEDDKKLLFIVVDGMIQSKGSDYAEHEVLLVNVLGYKGQVEVSERVIEHKREKYRATYKPLSLPVICLSMTVQWLN